MDDKEIERVVDVVATDTPNYDSELLNLKTKDQAGGEGGSVGAKLRERDPLYEQAVEIVIREQRGSTSLLQRALGIGYGKASRFVDYMAEDGIVGGVQRQQRPGRAHQPGGVVGAAGGVTGLEIAQRFQRSPRSRRERKTWASRVSLTSSHLRTASAAESTASRASPIS